MRRALRSGPRREVVVAATGAALFAVLLGLRVALQLADPSAGAPLGWLRLGAVLLLALLVSAAALGRRAPGVGRVVLRVEQAAVFIAVTRLLGLGAQPDPGRPGQILIALLGLHAVGAIVVSEELPSGTPPWRAGLWGLALSFGALTVTLFAP